MVTLDEEAGRASTTPLLVGVRHSTGLADLQGLTTSKYGAAEVDRSTAKVPAESSHTSIHTSRGGKSTEIAILRTHSCRVNDLLLTNISTFSFHSFVQAPSTMSSMRW